MLLVAVLLLLLLLLVVRQGDARGGPPAAGCTAAGSTAAYGCTACCTAGCTAGPQGPLLGQRQVVVVAVDAVVVKPAGGTAVQRYSQGGTVSDQ